jgi:aspartyl-tRNA(Asn)/glutamyl-tRNA(Gln) amidotransferase subunit C
MLTKKEVKHIADLAYLKLTEAKIRKYQKQLSEILEYVRKLQEVETEKVKPFFGGIDLKNVFREDLVKEISKEKREKILNQAPLREKDFIKTKGIFE